MYLLEISRLVLGDIILIRTNDSTCQKIREMSNSNYSHALIYRGNKCLLESHAFGVQSSNPQRLLLDNIDDAIVLRLKDKSKIYQLEIGLTNAAEKIGMSYASVREVMKSYLGNLEKAKEDKRQFCTRFVAQLYEESGIVIVENPDYCSPREIEDCQKLEKIENCVRQGTIAELELANEQDNSINKQTESTFNFFECIRNLFDNDLQTFGEVDDFLILNPQYDNESNKILIDSGYLDLGDIEKSKNEEFYDPIKFVQKFGIEYCSYISNNELNDEMVRSQNFKLAIDKYDNLYTQHNLEYFKSHRNCYKRQLELSYQRMNIFMFFVRLIN
jgi:hypothetical protein